MLKQFLVIVTEKNECINYATAGRFSFYFYSGLFISWLISRLWITLLADIFVSRNKIALQDSLLRSSSLRTNFCAVLGVHQQRESIKFKFVTAPARDPDPAPIYIYILYVDSQLRSENKCAVATRSVVLWLQIEMCVHADVENDGK